MKFRIFISLFLFFLNFQFILLSYSFADDESLNILDNMEDSLLSGSTDSCSLGSASCDLGSALENLGRVYHDESNDEVQEFWFLGRYHGQLYTLYSDDQNKHDYETRRLRLGFQTRFLRKFTIHAQMVSGSNVSPFYNGFTELWFQWAFNSKFALTIGQQKHRFTHDRNVSSRYLNYLERSMLTNMFMLDYTPAITAQGSIENATYYTGVFSNATGRNMGDSFLELDSGYSLIGAVYYDLKSLWGSDNITLHTTFLQSEAKENATNLNRFDKGLSAALIATKGYASLVTEITAGFEKTRGDAFGLNIQPTYFINEYIQLVSRYQLAMSDNKKGLSPQIRYERQLQNMEGDLYQAGYLGLAFYIARHRLKIMQGLEYANMNGRDTWTASLMLRFYFGPHSGGAFPMNQVLPLEYD